MTTAVHLLVAVSPVHWDDFIGWWPVVWLLPACTFLYVSLGGFATWSASKDLFIKGFIFAGLLQTTNRPQVDSYVTKAEIGAAMTCVH